MSCCQDAENGLSLILTVLIFVLFTTCFYRETQVFTRNFA